LAEQWQEGDFPPPNGGHLVFTIMGGGNPACASYDGAGCLWGQTKAQIDFARVKPLACGPQHRQLFGVTGYEDPKHWCNVALQSRPAAQNAQPAPPPNAGGYRLSDWSGWTRGEGVEYRYRIGWDPAAGGPGKTIEAIFEVRNRGSKTWQGSARSADCARNTLWGEKDVTVGPGQTKQVRVLGPNCRTAANPDIRPGVAQSKSF
jgi:hypothetical protein